MGLNFIYPEALWLLLLLPLLWAAALLGPPRRSQRRRALSLALRTLTTLCLVLAIAGAQLSLPARNVTTVFLLDGSDSVAASDRARAEAFVQQALAAMPPDDRAALVVFGREALVERPPSAERTLGQVAARPEGGTTNIAEALQLALALLPAESRQRIVLLSDGGETSGDALAAARLAAARDVPLDVVTLSGAAEGFDAQIVSVALPPAAREGQRLPLRVDIESSGPAAARITVAGPDGRPIADQPVALAGEHQSVTLLLPPAPAAFNRYTVRLEVPGDTRRQNNAAEAFSYVTGRPRVLIVAMPAVEAAALERALRAAQVDVTVVAPAQMPATLGELSLYDATALVNVPSRAIPETTHALLAAYVRELGHGLLMVGGPQSFGAGGWRATPVEAVLPVTMDIPTRLRVPPASVFVVIDISGSMAEVEDGRRKLSLAVEGAQRIAALLRDDDELTVIPFDSQTGYVVGPLPGSRREEVIDRLNRVEIGGGGINIHDALSATAGYVRASDRPVRHIITITDGADTTQQEGALDIVAALRAEGVTLTSIAIGAGEHVPFIRDMAGAGGGRTFLTERAADLPSILIDEAQSVIQPYLVEGQITPLAGQPHPALRAEQAAPPLAGYVATSPRATAQLLLTSPAGDPLLAAWQHGLGRSLAWTSDFSGRWAADWLTWEEFPRVSAGLVAWLIPPQAESRLSLTTATVGGDLLLDVAARDAGTTPLTGLAVTARLLASSGDVTAVELHEVSPGRYRAALRDQVPGAYLVQLVALDARGALAGSLTAGALVPLSAEHRSQAGSPALLEALARTTGGRIDPQPAQVFDAAGASRGATREVGLALLWLALLLLPLDIAVRRLFPWRDAPERPRGEVRRILSLLRTTLWPGAIPSERPAAREADPPPAPRPPTPEEQAQRAAELAKLRAAQEAARRRLRGEE